MPRMTEQSAIRSDEKPCRCDELEKRIEGLEKVLRDSSIAVAKHVAREQGIGIEKKKS